MKKRIVTALLCLLALTVTAGAAFSDIPDAEMASAAATLQSLGIVSGTGGTNFTPAATLDRAQVCQMLVNTMGLSHQINSHSRKTLFSDVAPTAWYNGSVNLAYAKGLVNGYGNGKFGPTDPVTYGQFATVLLRLLGYTAEDVGYVWPMDYTDYCDELGLSEGLSLDAGDELTRGEAALLLARTLKENSKGTGKEYYRSISGVSSVQEAILLDVNASYGGSDGLAMVYLLGGESGVQYYSCANEQSGVLAGSLGALLFDGAGRVMGFVPESESSRDVKIGEATASTLTAADGSGYRIASGATVTANGEVYTYATGGYLQLDAAAGKTVRLFYDENGAITHLYLTGGTAASSAAAVAETAAAESSLARALGIAGTGYAVTKNGAAADASSLARYDVGYYDAASNTLRASDYRVSGFISSASPNLAAAESVTVADYTFTVLESAWDTLGGFSVGEKVTLLLTDDGKVAAALAPSVLTADMVGVLAKDGRSVTLLGSGVKLSADTVSYEADSLGGLVNVSAESRTKLRCTAVLLKGQALDIAARTLAGKPLAASCSVFEWGGSGFVYDLAGNFGVASSDFADINWTDALDANFVSWYHTNSAGEVDALLLKNVTGNSLTYGRIRSYEGEAGIKIGSGGAAAANRAATVTNAAGTSSKYLCPYSDFGNYAYVGVALGQSSYGHTRVSGVCVLKRLGGVSAEEIFLRDGAWYVELGGEEYRISENVQLHLIDANTWLEGETGLASVLSGGYTLTLFVDALPSAGGQIRVIAVDK